MTEIEKARQLDSPVSPLLRFLPDARALFASHLHCDETQLRKIYLRLALKYHPDKHPESDRELATAFFQAIGAAYEELLRPHAAKMKRIKSAVAAAAELGDVGELAKLLRELPSRATEPDDVGVFPLMFAAKGGCIEAAQLLVDCAGDVNAETPFGWSVLLYAGLANQGAMARWLVSQGAVVTSHDLVLVAFGGFADSLAALLELYPGHVPDVRTDVGKLSLLHLTCIGIRNLERGNPDRYLKCIELLLGRAVHVDAVDSHDRTCLQHYVGHPDWVGKQLERSPVHLDLVQMLCAAKANPDLRDPKGNTAVSLAASQGLCRVGAILKSWSADASKL